MTYDKYEARKARIEKWFDEYIVSTFVSVNQFGHLCCNHLNKSDAFLMSRSTKIHKDTSSFIGEEEDVYKMLISIILEHRIELIEYLADTDDKETWEVRDSIRGNVKGKKYSTSTNHNWKEGAIVCTGAVIAFKKNSNNFNSLVITSAYPV